MRAPPHLAPAQVARDRDEGWVPIGALLEEQGLGDPHARMVAGEAGD